MHPRESSAAQGSRFLWWVGSLAGRLTLLLAAFIVLATVAVAFREYRVGRRRLVAETERTLDARAAAAADRLEAALAERGRLVTLWSELETSQDLSVDDVDKRVSQSLGDLAATLAGGTEAVAVRGETLLSSSDPARLGGETDPLPAFVVEGLRSGGTGVSLVDGGAAAAVLAISEVVSRVDGAPLGRIAVWTPLSRFLVSAVPLGLGTMRLVAAGRVLFSGADLADADDAYLWARDTAATTSGPVEVGVARPRVEVTAQLRASATQLVTLATLFLLLALPATLVVVRSATRSLGGLTRAARELDAHHPGPIPPASSWAPREVRVLADAMGSMVDRLERAREEVARSESLAAVGLLTKSLAHEIRTPLSVLRAGTEMLQRAPNAGPREREVGAMLQAEVGRLSRLVDDLLVFGRPATPVPVATDFATVAADAVGLLDGDAAEAGVAVSLDAGPAPLLADPDQLRQVVVNLVTNAVRACEGGGTVTVRTTGNADTVTLEVRDDGVGIPAERLDDVWKPLVTTHRSGTGLGLPIVRQLIEAHGGRAELTSTPGEGTCVRVILPTGGEASR